MAQSDTVSHVIQEGEDKPTLPEPTPVPVKRGPGRPPKHKNATSRAPGAQPSDQPKRGRGRPRKNPDAPPRPKRDPNTLKRPPGRPRKDASKPVDPNAPKKASDSKEDSAQDDHDAASSADPSAQPNEDGVKKKRNPGRPKKGDSGARKVGRPRKRPLEAAASKGDPTVAAAGKGDHAVEEAPAKRRRGRPPKKAAAAHPTQPEADDGSWKPFRLHVSFEDSSSETEQPNAATVIAALASGNGELTEKPREHRESSETSYSTPEPEVEP